MISGRDSERKYKAPLYLTEKGRIAGMRIADKIDAVLLDTGAALEADERETFYRCLGIISARLERIADKHG